MIDSMRGSERVLLPLLLGGWLGACATAPAAAPSTLEAESTNEFGSAEQEILELINAYRESHELPRLVLDPMISDVARQHSQAMLKGEAPFSHAGLSERRDIISRSVDLLHIDENLFTIEPPSMFTSFRVVRSWLRNDRHRQDVEGCFDLTGIGIAGDEQAVYVTQIFVRRKPEMRSDVQGGMHSCHHRAGFG